MKNRFNSLYGKIAGIFLVLLLVLGVAQWQVWLRASMDFATETEQKLNRDLARDLAERFAPFLKDSLDYAAIEHTFHELMVMNPRVEIYLLDEEGNLLAYFAEPEKIRRMAVQVEPIRRFLEQTAPLPVYGDDPRSQSRQKPFSAAPVLIGGQQRGYLYVILAGEQYDSISSMLEGSYIAKTSAFVLAGVLLLTGLAGLMLFFLLTRRLRRMIASVRKFEEGDYRERIAVRAGDEIGQLGRAFNQMADTIVATLEEIRRTDALRRDLVANVSHDLRTPLANIQGYLETVLMKDQQLGAEERRRFLEIIYHNVTMLNRLVGELFELSKLEARQTEPRPEPFSLAELVQDTALDFQSQAAKQGVALNTALPEDLPLVRADIGMIERALANLIENALQYTPSGGRVTIALEQEEEGVRVSVADTGRGIPARDLPRVFDRFYRADKTRAAHKGGTGLGLAIAQKIVQVHGGALAVESQEEIGTTFSFALPLYRGNGASMERAN
jgi:signal transduction histidine kinase